MQSVNQFEHILTKDYLQEEYVNKKRSATKIGKEHGICHNTVLKYIRIHGFDIGIRNGQLEPGMVFNRLTTVKKHSVTKNGTVRWECLCECGNTTHVSTAELKRNVSGRFGTVSCGCLHNSKTAIKNQENIARKSPKWSGYEDISNNTWTVILRGAKARSINVDISIIDAWNIFIGQEKKCYLSGLDLNFLSNHIASLDRIDSRLGYTIENSKWCHKDINRIKWKFDKNIFIKHCINLYLFDGLFQYEEIDVDLKMYAKQLKRGAQRRSYSFNIDEKDILNTLRNQGGKCALTGIDVNLPENSRNKRLKEYNGSVDRIDNRVGYEKNNIQIIHKDLNKSRGPFELNYYKELCKLIAIHNTKIT